MTTYGNKDRIIGHSEEETDSSVLYYCNEYCVEPEDPGPEGIIQGVEVGCWKEKAVGLKKRWEFKVGLDQVKKQHK